jgi:hypothetical protein
MAPSRARANLGTAYPCRLNRSNAARSRLSRWSGVRDANQFARALAQVLAVKVRDTIFGDDVMHVGPGRHYTGARLEYWRQALIPLLVTLGSARIGLPPSLKDAPRTKSIWPPTPLNWRVQSSQRKPDPSDRSRSRC